jgi:hypothetical protein
MQLAREASTSAVRSSVEPDLDPVREGLASPECSPEPCQEAPLILDFESSILAVDGGLGGILELHRHQGKEPVDCWFFGHEWPPLAHIR